MSPPKQPLSNGHRQRSSKEDSLLLSLGRPQAQGIGTEEGHPRLHLILTNRTSSDPCPVLGLVGEGRGRQDKPDLGENEQCGVLGRIQMSTKAI